MTTEKHDDLFWQAYRYSAGELDDRESQAFEDSLEEDPAACEALVQVVRLSEDIQAVFSSQPEADQLQQAQNAETLAAAGIEPTAVSLAAASESPNAVSRLGRRIGLTVTAATVLAAAVFLFNPNHSRDSEVAVDDGQRSQQLIRIWVDPDAAWQQVPESAVAEADMEPLESAELESDVPEWLLVAVQTERAGADIAPDDDEILEN